MRIREAAEDIPKPMIPIGHRPILWHVMKYYAHYGHKDFILCLGYRGDVIRKYFLNYEETLSNDFVLSGGGGQVELMNRDISDWRITFVDTGVNSNIGQRLVAARKYLGDDKVFLANYSDGLSDIHLPGLVERFQKGDKIANLVCVKPNLSFHAVTTGANGLVNQLTPVGQTDFRVNGGFFMLKREIFDYMQPGEELVLEPFQRLIAKHQLAAFTHEGFFGAMDTFKDKQLLDDLYARGKAPWEVWRADVAAGTA